MTPSQPGPRRDNGAVRGRGRPRKPETDEAILRAGYEVFRDHGVAGTSIEEIARRAGVGKLTVYRRWSSKEELLAAAIEQQVIDQGPWPTEEELADGNPREILEAMLPEAAEAAALPTYRAMLSQVLGSAVSSPDVFAAYWERYLAPRREASATLLRRAQQQGLIDADVDLDVLLDMMAGAVLYRTLQPDPPDAAQMRRYLTELYRTVGLFPRR